MPAGRRHVLNPLPLPPTEGLAPYTLNSKPPSPTSIKTHVIIATMNAVLYGFTLFH